MSDSDGTNEISKQLKGKIDGLRTFLELMSFSYFVDEDSSDDEKFEFYEESEEEESTANEPKSHVLPANSAVTDVHQCKTCRPHSTNFLYQQTTTFPYLSPIPPIMIEVLRIYRFSKGCAVSGSNDGDRLELAILDFVNRKEYSEKYGLSSLMPLGFTCEVRIKSKNRAGEKEIYIVRALVGNVPFPSKDIDWPATISKMTLYGGAMFKLFEPVNCFNTVVMFIRMMEMNKTLTILGPFKGC